MKYIFTLCLVVFSIGLTKAQNNKHLPSVELKNLVGETVDVSKISNQGKPVIISFWATWCKPCKEELNAISKKYKQWQKETGVELVAISIDNSRSLSRVKPYVKDQGWNYTILLDSNGDLKKKMNIVNVPHTLLIDSKGTIVWEHNNYKSGDEEELYKKLKSLSK